MAARSDIQLDVLSDPRWLRTVRALVRGFLESCAFPNDRIMELVLAVDEACTNAMRHSYDGDKERRIRLRFRAISGGAEIVVRDKGKPAPFEKVRKKDFSTPTKQDVQPGGRGIQILYEVFDEVKFAPGARSGNCVTLRAYLPSRRRPVRRGKVRGVAQA